MQPRQDREILQGLLSLGMERDWIGIYTLEVNALRCLSAPILSYTKPQSLAHIPAAH